MLILFLCAFASANECSFNIPKDFLSDISDGESSGDSIILDNLTFTKENYFVAENNQIIGCICNVITCIRKCCPEKSSFVNNSCKQNGEEYLDLIFYNQSERVEPEDISFNIVYSMTCPENYDLYPINESFIELDGRLYSQENKRYFSLDLYCVDYFDGKMGSLVCLTKDPPSPWISAGKIIYL